MQTLYKLGNRYSGLFAEYGELEFDAEVFEGEDVVEAIAAGWYETPWEAKIAEEAAEAKVAEEVTKRTRRTKEQIEADKKAEEAAQQAESEAAQNGADN